LPREYRIQKQADTRRQHTARYTELSQERFKDFWRT
jgi:hypothetical protein